MINSSSDFTFSLDNLLFHTPLVHTVKPLCQEQSAWKLGDAPDISTIPATQELQKETDSQASTGQTSFVYSQKPKKFLPPLRRPGAGGGQTSESGHQEMSESWRHELSVSGFYQGSGATQNSGETPVFHPNAARLRTRSVFSEFPYFNYVQSKALDDVLYSSRNFVACAPTGSGKTVLFELAVIRVLTETTEPWHDVKAVYMAPIKALCSQRYENWKQKFGPLGLNCKEVTGDTEIDDYFEIQGAHLIMTTPEKWDSLTRKWRDNVLLHSVRLVLIDEIHVVKDVTRGATLEVVVSRMKTMQSYHRAEEPQSKTCMRFVAVSEWLSDESGPAVCLKMDESHRPVKLRKVVLGFPCGKNQNEFKFDLSLNYKMASVIQTYSDQKPTLVVRKKQRSSSDLTMLFSPGTSQ
ncbi:putative ATP-dependent DNA helicase HFM1 [Bagarius yarrelli]|uniref:Putative ATP-dependent DNA helicase HFM1 n=1 Tax=Bagarius yarrelli TaxID=175774 RepID=A0A556V0D4_BAGYA|nr:putative ATP-dependent DNA helicase HFM1 [Bagarius yarrelli]